jgi:hypothetical protein
MTQISSLRDTLGKAGVPDGVSRIEHRVGIRKRSTDCRVGIDARTILTCPSRSTLPRRFGR